MKNVFAGSILRQPLRSALLFLMIALAAFVFMLRIVEYVVVRNQIMEIAGFYRPVGFLHAEGIFGDVSEGLVILENSPNVDFIDYRRTAEGVLSYMRNADFGGEPRLLPREQHTRRNYVFFYGVAQTSWRDGNMEGLWLTVDNAVVGFEEHIIDRQNQKFLERIVLQNEADLFDDMEMGMRYFVRGFYYETLDGFGLLHLPVRGMWTQTTIVPLNYEIEGAEPIYFIPVPAGESVDFTRHGLEHLYQLLDEIYFNQRSVVLRTTSDMGMMPSFLGDQPIMRMAQGRHISREDYLSGAQVAVINSEFARHRNLSIGDTIILSVPEIQRFDGIHSRGIQFGYGDFGSWMYVDLLVASEFESQPVFELELEIIGIFQYIISGIGTRQSLPIFIPDSILPSDFEVLPPLNPSAEMADWGYGHVPDSWISFTLTDSRLEQAFYLEYAPLFAQLGLELVVIGANSANFWATATPILTIVGFNAIIFTILLVLVFSLAMFLHLRNHNREFVISRALGVPKYVVMLRACLSTMLLCIPAIMLGGYPAWILGIDLAAESLMPLADIVEGIEVISSLSLGWLAGFFSGVVGLLAVIAFAGSAFMLSMPVLELLQVQRVRNKSKGSKPLPESTLTHPLAQPDFFDLPKASLKLGVGARIRNALRWVWCHILRQPLKTALGVSVALFFVFSLGWLQESINQGRHEIERLYNSTIVYADVRTTNRHSSVIGGGLGSLTPGFHIGGVIQARTVHQIRDLSFTENVFTEAGHIRSFVIPATPDGLVPENWPEIIGYNLDFMIAQNLDALNFLYSFSDFNRFIFEHSRGFDDRFITDIAIEFYPGFDESVFTSDENLGELVPLVLYEGMMYDRGFALGESVILAYTHTNLRLNLLAMPAVIVGTHNGQINREGLEHAMLLPSEHKEYMLGNMASFITLNFTIEPAYNRNIDMVREETANIIQGGGFVPLTLFLLDEELRNAVVAMEQSLLMLELLLPIVIGLSAAIGAALAMFLMMQSKRNVAILRALGVGKLKTKLMLLTEQLAIMFAGVVVGVIVIFIMGWSLDIATTAQTTGLYVAGSFVGLVMGVTRVVDKSPLDMLQVKE